MGFSRSITTIVAIVITLAVAVGLLAYKALDNISPLSTPQAVCTVEAPNGSVSLNVEQAQIASTIAAVAARRELPERAAVIAYATAIQESKLHNLDHGDRDSLGVFQQRPSQGWGTPEQIMDPVYSANRFFTELLKVKRYRELPIAEAAQAVQRSAAGYAYANHERRARILAAAFTGRIPQAVHCYFPPTDSPSPTHSPSAKTADSHAVKARRELVKVLGGTAVPSIRRGWLIATWAVTHADLYGLSQVGFDGAAWSPTSDSWAPDDSFTDSAVSLI